MQGWYFLSTQYPWTPYVIASSNNAHHMKYHHNDVVSHHMLCNIPSTGFAMFYDTPHTM